MPENALTIYGVEWCGDCRRTRKFLDEYQIPYKWINIDKDKAGEQFVIKTNRGNRSVPTLVFPDGSILVEPSNNQLATRFAVGSPKLAY
jgi:glutaredoxin-like protein